MRWRLGIVIIVALSGLALVRPAWAHATLLRSVPPANAVLDQAPAKIQLWFSEALEPSYSGIDVLDSTGKKINPAEATVDPSDPTSMSVEPGPLPDGVYTIAWRNVSRDDGHPLTGSFAISVGQAAPGAIAASSADIDPIPTTGRVLSQWLLFLFASAVIGGTGFWAFIWQQAPSQEQPRAERWLHGALWMGYVGLGVAVALSLLEQAVQVGAAADLPGLVKILGTRFGAIWLARLVIWVVLGVSLAWAVRRRQRIAWWITLIVGPVFLVTVTLLSHSVSAEAAIPAMGADWLHLTATSLWVGGLIAFGTVLIALRANPATLRLRATLTQYFSNMARVAVAALLLTGLFAAWLQVGSLQALLDTNYGQTLALKVVLIVPLLLIAAVNLLLTQRRLGYAAQTDTPTRWSGVLRGLVGAEIVLTALVLLVAGVLTSAVPARSVVDERAASATTASAAGYADMQMTTDAHLILGISPGYAGTNTFSVGLFDMMTDEAINDATLVRLQFTPKDVAIGKSQVRATFQGKGQYVVTGANLSLPGEWKIRVSVQRPNRYDDVVDFDVKVPPAPATTTGGPLPLQGTVLVLLGTLEAVTGGFFLRGLRRGRWSGGRLLALGLLVCGLVFVGAGLVTFTTGPGSAAAVAGVVAVGASAMLLELASRWLGYLALAVLGGGFVFVPAILQPALASASRQSKQAVQITGSFSETSGLARVLGISCGLAIIAALADAIAPAVPGVLPWIRLLILLGAAVLLVFRRSRFWRRDFAQYWWWGGAVLVGAALIITGLESHAAVGSDPLLPLTADWLHLAGVTIWLGGLVALLLALRWLRRAAQGQSALALAHLIGRFSLVATVCLVVLGVSGAYLAFADVADPANLVDTNYGMVLLLKLALMILLFVLGAVNIVLVRRRIRRVAANDPEPAAQPWYHLIRQTVGAEIIFVTAILLVTSVLVSLPLARDAFGPGMVLHRQAGDLRAVLAANPGLPGRNTIDLYLRDAIGQPVNNAQNVALSFTMLDHDMGRTDAAATNAGGGRYTVQGDYLGMVGTWRVETLVQRQGQDDVRLEFVLPLQTAPSMPGAPVLVYPSRALTGLAMVAGGLAMVFASRRVGRKRVRTGTMSAAFGILIGLFGFGVIASGFILAYNQVAALKNPIPADVPSLARGQQVYAANCVACHGSSGRGDGPASAGLQPPPSDLQVHMAAGHSDGQLFDWITNGIPGSAMPVFRYRLTEAQRWDVVNYIRTFAAP